jgi:SAM-dependent methyltransferase
MTALRKQAARWWKRLTGAGAESAEPWVQAVRTADAEFDQRHGVDTGGIVELHRLDVVGDNRRHGVKHVAILPAEFDAALSALPWPVVGSTFVDVGCGKGRALLLAARQPFTRLVGLDFAPALIDAARRNTRALGVPVELHCADAAGFQFPPGPLVIYLYNPFGPAVMDAVARHAAEATGPVQVMYLNPFQEGSWLAAGFKVAARGPTFAIYTREG